MRLHAQFQVHLNNLITLRHGLSGKLLKSDTEYDILTSNLKHRKHFLNVEKSTAVPYMKITNSLT